MLLTTVSHFLRGLDDLETFIWLDHSVFFSPMDWHFPLPAKTRHDSFDFFDPGLLLKGRTFFFLKELAFSNT